MDNIQFTIFLKHSAQISLVMQRDKANKSFDNLLVALNGKSTFVRLIDDEGTRLAVFRRSEFVGMQQSSIPWTDELDDVDDADEWKRRI